MASDNLMRHFGNIIPRARKHPGKWIPGFRQGVLKSRPRWGAYINRIGIVGEYPHPLGLAQS